MFGNDAGQRFDEARAELERGVMPVRELFDGLCLLVAGALLLTPGFVTDALGFLLFLPPFRALVARLRMYTCSGAIAFIRIRSPSSAPPVRLRVGSTDNTAIR